MEKFEKHFFALFIIFLPVLFSSCKQSSNPVAYEIANTPIITGILVTGPDSPYPLRIIGTPNEKSTLTYNGPPDNKLPHRYSIEPPYPNPAYNGTNIRFTLPVQSNISLWVVRGRAPAESPNHSAYLNGYYAVPSNRFSMKLMEGKKYAGVYTFLWDGKDQNRETLPDGLYRIYLSVDGGGLMWRDVMIYHSLGEQNFPNIF